MKKNLRSIRIPEGGENSSGSEYRNEAAFERWTGYQRKASAHLNKSVVYINEYQISDSYPEIHNLFDSAEYYVSDWQVFDRFAE